MITSCLVWIHSDGRRQSCIGSWIRASTTKWLSIKVAISRYFCALSPPHGDSSLLSIMTRHVLEDGCPGMPPIGFVSMDAQVLVKSAIRWYASWSVRMEPKINQKTYANRDCYPHCTSGIKTWEVSPSSLSILTTTSLDELPKSERTKRLGSEKEKGPHQLLKVGRASRKSRTWTEKREQIFPPDDTLAKKETGLKFILRLFLGAATVIRTSFRCSTFHYHLATSVPLGSIRGTRIKYQMSEDFFAQSYKRESKLETVWNVEHSVPVEDEEAG